MFKKTLATITKGLLWVGKKIITEEVKVVKRGSSYVLVSTTKLFCYPVAVEEFKVKDVAHVES